MDEQRKKEIYQEECGYTCPGLSACVHCLPGGTCELDEPWFDCDEFQATYDYAIQDAENRIELEEEE